MLKRLTGLLMIMIILLNMSACSGANNPTASAKEPGEFYYAEEELGGKSDWNRVNGIGVDSKKQLILFDEGMGVPRFITLDAEGREIGSFDCAHKLEGGKVVVSSLFALDNRDNIYLFNEITDEKPEDENNTEYTRRIYVYSPDGTLTKTLELEKRKGEMDYVESIVVGTGGEVYICSANGLKVYDPEGGSTGKIDREGFVTACAGEDGSMLFITRREGIFELEKYAPDSGNTAWKKELNPGGHPNGIYFSPYDKNIYISGVSDIGIYDNQGNYSGQLLDYSETGILPGEQYMSGFVVDESKRIYISMRQGYEENGKSFKLYKYVLAKDDGTRASRKLLTISTMHRDTMLESMAKKFQLKHPDIKVKVKSMDEEGEGTTEEVMKKFNAEIISGNAADLICLDGLPYKKYYEKNIFADLGEFINRDSSFDINKLYRNIIEACKYKGKLYAMPVTFTFDAVQVDEALTKAQGALLDVRNWTWETFCNAASRQAKDKNGDGKTDIYGLAKTDPLELFENIFSSTGKQFIDTENKSCSFDSEEFVKLLKMIKTLSSKEIMHDKLDYEALYYDSSKGSIGFNFINNLNTFEFTIAKCMLGDDTQIYPMPRWSKEAPATFDATMYAINSSSSMKEEAWEFIKFITSDGSYGRGNSVNRDTLENTMKEMMKPENGSTLMISNDKGETRTIVIEPYTEKQNEQMKSMIEDLGQLNDYNLQLKTIIEGELRAYLNDQRSAEDVAKLIQNRVNIYLNE